MNTQKPKVVVVGSLNMDLVVKAERQPQKGETLIGHEFGMFPGGKGSNQAIAGRAVGNGGDNDRSVGDRSLWGHVDVCPRRGAHPFLLCPSRC